MERRFHLFVRRCPSLGYHVEVLGRAELSTFAEDLDEARADLARVLSRLLSRDPEFERATPTLRDVRVRRVDLSLRAVQGDRLLPVLLRLTAVLHAPVEESDAPLGSVVLRVPRLRVQHTLASESDLDAFVEEIVRRRLFLADASTLLELAQDGDESVELLTVSYRRASSAPEDEPRSTVAPATIEACRERTAEARSGSIDRAFARDELLARLTSMLLGRRKNSVLLVGPSGVGKSAIVHELAYRMIEAEEGSLLHGMQLWTTSGAQLVAGMRYLGEWQARVQRVLDALRTRPAVLHIESLGELIASAQGEQGMDIPGYLLPSIEAGELVLLCEATAEDLARAERTHPAFVRALRVVHVAALEGKPRRAALESLASRITRGKRMRFSEDALVRAEDLCERFGDGSALPGAAVPLLRAVVSAATSDNGVGTSDATRALGADEVTRAFCERTGYPRVLIDPSLRLDPDDVLVRLRSRVVGQEPALALLRDLIVTLKTGMSDPARPLGSFLFLGPTGVGKTESALALAHYLFGDERRVARFDMGEYAAPHSAARLVSDAPGARGSLTTRMREQPFGVVLFDEIEKAHPGVHDLLLQILGEGRLSDSVGRSVSFRSAVVVLTSNLGADTVHRSMGFSAGATKDVAAHYVSAATQFFRPELINRIDHIVPFAPLSDEIVRTIARKALESAFEREGFVRRAVRVHFDDEVVAAIARIGFDPRYGARPLKRAIEQWAIAPVARILAARGARPPTQIELVAREGGIAVAPTSAPEVSAMSAEEVRSELSRRAARSKVTRAMLKIEPIDAGAGARARWLLERYESWCESHGAEVTATSSGSLVVRGPIAEALSFEQGTHEFESTSGIARVRVTVVTEPPTSREEGVRLYTMIPELTVWDVVTELEQVGPWERAVEPASLDRFALARIATAAA
jgi:ATP-dependent Clp protease ATP-binding subunit ClpC